MSVTVHMHGNLRRFMPEGRDRTAMEVAPGTTIEALLASLGAELDTWLVAVNGTACEKDRVLQQGEQVEQQHVTLQLDSGEMDLACVRRPARRVSRLDAVSEARHRSEDQRA